MRAELRAGVVANLYSAYQQIALATLLEDEHRLEDKEYVEELLAALSAVRTDVEWVQKQLLRHGREQGLSWNDLARTSGHAITTIRRWIGEDADDTLGDSATHLSSEQWESVAPRHHVPKAARQAVLATLQERERKSRRRLVQSGWLDPLADPMAAEE